MRATLQRSALVALLLPAVASWATAQGTAADYERAAGLRAKYTGLVTGAPEAPTWLDSTSTRFWYRVSVKGGNQFVLVDASTLDKHPAFDHAKIAAGLSTAGGKPYTAITLPFTTFTFTDSERAIDFAADSSTWRCRLDEGQCTRTGRALGGRGGGGGGRGNGAPQNDSTRVSPDGHTIAFIDNFNIWVRPATGPGARTALSFDGSEGNPYQLQSVAWAPDSRHLAAYRVRPGYRRMVRYVQSSPADQVQPKTFERFYAKPGDVLDLQQPSLFDITTRKEVVVSDALFPNPYGLSRIEWRKDSHAFTFEYNERGHQRYRVIEVDAASGVARAVITEASPTFIDYRKTNGNLTDSGRQFRYDVADGKEIIWMSERDGWAHLYLVDGATGASFSPGGITGAVKNQITKGNWLVRGVQRVDEAARQVYFSAAGRKAGEDPYFSQYYRINFDGSGLIALTDAPANHSVVYSGDGKYYVDTWTRTDLAPVSQLRSTSTRQVLLELEKGDATALTAAGWHAPEVFVAKARDGVTDIWGVIIRPTNFDPSRKYPVIENIYAGPQGSFVPKTFTAFNAMQSLAELGFIVVQMDGMGTANRSKAFHDVAFKNLGDAGFPDRILWHKAVAAKYPWYDITRVGVYGTSAGGQNSLGALLFHPEFYKAAVSAAGCHDNRMDKVWWNELWMGSPLGPEYEASSNVVHANKLQGKLLLVVGELDTNVDPSSTMQVVNALIKSNKMFDLLVIPGADHTNGGPYGERKRDDFFVHHLLAVEPPDRNTVPVAVQGSGSGEDWDWGPSWDVVWRGFTWEGVRQQ